MKPSINLIFGALLTVVFITCAGCGDDPVSPGSTPDEFTSELPYPADPDLLLENFSTAYQDMNLAEFRYLLHPAYSAFLLQGTLDEWDQSLNPLTESYFTQADEIRIHEHIFAGTAGVDVVGNPVPPVSSLDVVYFDKQGSTWTAIPTSDPDFGDHRGYYATLDILIHFNTQDDHRFEVSQSVQLYVMPVDDDGQEKWQLLGLRELEAKVNGTEELCLGDIKALYR